MTLSTTFFPLCLLKIVYVCEIHFKEGYSINILLALVMFQRYIEQFVCLFVCFVLGFGFFVLLCVCVGGVVCFLFVCFLN